MRLIFCNHRLSDGAWTRGEWVQRAFERSGVELTVVKTGFRQRLLQQIVQLDPLADAVFFLSEYTIPADVAYGQLSARSLPLILWTDDSVVWEHPSHLMKSFWRHFLKCFAVVFELFPQSLPLLRGETPARVELVPHAWEPAILESAKDIVPSKDVVFWGRVEGTTPDQTGDGWYMNRGAFINALKERGIEVFHSFSHDAKEWARGLAAGKIVLNVSMAHNLNMRYFETLGLGRFLLTDRGVGAETFFKDRRHLCFYDSLDDAAETILYYLNHSDEREQIAQAGQRQVVLGKHTYDDRVARITEILKETL